MSASHACQRRVAVGVGLLLSVGPLTASAAGDSSEPNLNLELSTRLEHRSPVVILAREAELSANEESVLRGDVEVRYGERILAADEVRYSPRSREISASGNIRFGDPELEITGALASFERELGGGAFTAADFALQNAPGRGGAAQISRLNENVTVFEGVSYTTCPVEQEDWLLRARHLELDTDAEVGVARKVRLKFKGVPIFYAPFLSFPLSDKRKSGFLPPDIGRTDRSGADISTPYYLNLRPNLDATITPRFLADRGLQMNGLMRYLQPRSQGALRAEYLHDDDKTGDTRHFTSVQHETRFNPDLRLIADINDTSDGQYFEDLGNSLSAASVTYLERRVDIGFNTGRWRLQGRIQNFQTLDQSIGAEDKPYERLPRFQASALWPQSWLGLDYAFRGELSNLDRSTGVTGVRVDVQPEISLPLGHPGLSLTPRVALQHTRYALDNEALDQDDNPTLTAPIVTLDGRIKLERTVVRAPHMLQTLEPRVQYTYIPRRNQDDLPVFDTGQPDVNQIQLFRANRFAGADRVGDADQVAVGITSRLLNSETGRELLNATLGGAFFFEDRDVTLPGETRETDDFSDLLAAASLRLSEHWNADLDYQYDPENYETQKAAVRLQFRPIARSVVNLGYRYRRAELEQSDISFAVPIGGGWELLGRWNFSLPDSKTLDRFIGMGYESCCWAVRLVSRRYVSTREGNADDAIFAQFELKGLTGVGSRTGSLLDRGILGYTDNFD